MCSSCREGGFNQASHWLACPGPSKRLTGGRRERIQGWCYDIPSSKDIRWAGSISDTVCPCWELMEDSRHQAPAPSLARVGSSCMSLTK